MNNIRIISVSGSHFYGHKKNIIWTLHLLVHREKYLRNCAGGTGCDSATPAGPASLSLARYSGLWSAIHGCPPEGQNRQRQKRQRERTSAYCSSSRSPCSLEKKKISDNLQLADGNYSLSQSMIHILPVQILLIPWDSFL